MPRDPRKLLEDIRRACERIQRYTADRDLGDYLTDDMLRDAVERRLITIGEALTQLSKADATTVGQVSEYRRIISFRNLLIHAYDDIDDRVVWGVVRGNVQDLLDEVSALLPDD